MSEPLRRRSRVRSSPSELRLKILAEEYSGNQDVEWLIAEVRRCWTAIEVTKDFVNPDMLAASDAEVRRLRRTIDDVRTTLRIPESAMTQVSMLDALLDEPQSSDSTQEGT